jgi:hypothetical protein
VPTSAAPGRYAAVCAGLAARPARCRRPYAALPPPIRPQAPPPPTLRVRAASSAADYRAAGYLRAYSFYSFPPDRSEFAARVGAALVTRSGAARPAPRGGGGRGRVLSPPALHVSNLPLPYSRQAHRRMKGDAEWEAIAAKVAGARATQRCGQRASGGRGWPDTAAAAVAAGEAAPPSSRAREPRTLSCPRRCVGSPARRRTPRPQRARRPGTDKVWSSVRVACLVATLEDDPQDPLARQARGAGAGTVGRAPNARSV